MQAEAHEFLMQRGSMAGTLAGLLTAPLAPSGPLAAYYASEPSAGGEIGARAGVLGLGT